MLLMLSLLLLLLILNERRLEYGLRYDLEIGHNDQYNNYYGDLSHIRRMKIRHEILYDIEILCLNSFSNIRKTKILKNLMT